MTYTIVDTAIFIGPDGPEIEIPEGMWGALARLLVFSFQRFAEEPHPAFAIPGARYRFLLESDGNALIGGRLDA